MNYTPTSLKRWSLPSNYCGATWDGWYVFLGQHRGSDILTRSNFTCGFQAVQAVMSKDSVPGDEDESATVQVVRESHWAVGWVEWIAIHESDSEALKVADEIAAALEDYPVVDDEHHSQLEEEEANRFWASLSVRERVEICQKYRVNVFKARHDYYPDTDNGSIRDYLTA